MKNKISKIENIGLVPHKFHSIVDIFSSIYMLLISKKSRTKISKICAGFTLIEVLVAVGLFAVVMVVGISAVLNVNTTYKKTEKMRTLIDNMGFVMEDMARTIRTGTKYICGYPENIIIINGTISSDTVSDYSTIPSCNLPLSHTITLEAVGGSPTDGGDQVVYAIAPLGDNDSLYGTIFKSIDGGGQSYVALTPREIRIDMNKSGFTVIGADNTFEQPRITINLEGTISYHNETTPFTVQTTVVSRAPKIITP